MAVVAVPCSGAWKGCGSLQAQGHVSVALAKGAKALTGFRKADLQACCDRDYIVSPTVLSHLSNSNNDQVVYSQLTSCWVAG